MDAGILCLNSYKKLNVCDELKYFMRVNRPMLIVIYHLTAFETFGKHFFIPLITFMEKVHSFYWNFTTKFVYFNQRPLDFGLFGAVP